jgi:glyceraldehyde-3-phosphate dehydrogenase/erythrose-4-phosphate dehydrogenase
MTLDTIKSVNQLTNNLSDYYLNLLKSWISINKYTKISIYFRTIINEIIWVNQHIKFKNKSLIYINWINDGIIFINDIIDHEGKLSENFILKKHCL